MACSISKTTTAMADPYRAWEHPWTYIISGLTGLYNNNKMILFWIEYSKEKKTVHLNLWCC